MNENMIYIGYFACFVAGVWLGRLSMALQYGGLFKRKKKEGE